MCECGTWVPCPHGRRAGIRHPPPPCMTRQASEGVRHSVLGLYDFSECRFQMSEQQVRPPLGVRGRGGGLDGQYEGVQAGGTPEHGEGGAGGMKGCAPLWGSE